MRIKNSINNMCTGILGQIITLILGFIVRTAFIKMLGTTYLGVSGLFSNILSMLSLAELGIGQAIIFSLYKPIAENNTEKICSLMDLYKKMYKVISIVVLMMGLGILPFLHIFIKDISNIPDLKIIYIIYVINSSVSYLFIYKTTFIIANQKNSIITKISLVFSIGLSIAQILVLITLKNYILYLIIQVIFTISQNIFISNKADRLYPFLKNKDILPLEAKEKEEIKRNIKALMIYKIGNLSLNSTDNLIISSFVGVVTVGLYSNYLLISSSITGFLSIIFSSLTASIGNLNACETTEKKIFMFKVINLVTFWLYGLVCICLFMLMSPFIELWIGKEFLLTTSEVFIICFNIYIGGMLFAPFNYRQTMGLFIYGKMRPVISAVINIVVSIILGKHFGLAGVLWGTAITRLTTNAWFDPYIVYKKGLGINSLPYYIDYLVKLIILMITGALCIYLNTIITITGIIGLALKGIILFFVINIVFILIFGRSEEFKYLIKVFSSLVFKNRRNLNESDIQ